jgi:DNA adenine methylase
VSGKKALEPIIKWPGGKERELDYILPNLPQKFNNYYEPFVGGGSVFTSIIADNYYVNDFSDELIGLYNSIKNLDKCFFEYAESMNVSFECAKRFSNKHFDTLCGLFLQYRANLIDVEMLSKQIEAFVSKNQTEIHAIINKFDIDKEFFQKELLSTLKRKLQRMKVLEIKKDKMPIDDIQNNIETAIKGSLYMYYRYLYNTYKDCNQSQKTALFFFLRNYAYSGMFRYNLDGLFNVPYGGIAYNNKLTRKKLEYYQSEKLQMILSKAVVENLDFENFLNKYQPAESDFVFLDPPYDSNFSTYAQNAFTRNDQKRLANYLLKECKASWMLVIKNTDFIYDLYSSKEGIRISSFDKEYTVSFMNRNDKKVKHLLIKNYV